MALQDGVTRIAAASANSRGGVGLMELCKVVGDLGGTGSGDLDLSFASYLAQHVSIFGSRTEPVLHPVVRD